MRILIAGGGIAGLSTAIALRQKGFDPEIIEKHSSWRSGGAGLHLPGNAVVPMDQLGILEDVDAKSFSFPEIRYCDHKDNKLFALDLTADDWPKFQAISRDAFHKILVDKAGDTRVRFDTEIKSLSQEADEPALVEFMDGKTDQYDLVIAADGINSSLRQMVFGSELKPVPAGISCWRWITESKGLLEPHFMLGRGKVLLTMPIDEKHAYVFASVTDPEGELLDVGNDVIQREFSDFGGIVPEIGFHSTIDNPDCVSLVIPPTTTISTTKKAPKSNQ